MLIPADNPIKDERDDLLGRNALANVLAEEIRSLDASEGCVVGILGPWGSGKTSLIHLVRAHLGRSPAMSILEFNPWLFSGTDQLLESFFREIGAQFRGRGDQLSALADDLEAYGEIVAPLGWLPLVGVWIERARGLTKVLKKVRESRKGGALLQRERLSKKLSALPTPVVIVIDDIDRLRTAEIRDVFKLVRLTANFPNLIYVLAFDRHRVETALSEEGLVGRDYLEKILQVAHDIPIVPETTITRLLTEALDASLRDIETSGPFSSDEWPDILFEIVRPLIRNIRDVRRYVAAVHGTVRGLEGRVDLADVLALESVRVFLPDVFERLVAAQEALTTPSRLHGNDPPTLKASVDSLLAAADGRVEIARSLISRLFHAGRRHIENNHFGPEWQREWLRKRRVAHPEILKFYLERVVGEKLSAFDAAERVYENLANSRTVTEILGSLEDRQLADVVAQLEAFEGSFPEEGLESGIVALMNALDRMPPRDGGLFGYSSELIVNRVVLRMLRPLNDAEKIETIVRNALSRFHRLSARYSLITLVGYQENAGHRLVSEDAAKDLEGQLAAQVKAAPPDALAQEHELLRLLYWTGKSDEDGSERHFRIPDDVELAAALLKGALAEVTSQALGSRTVRKSNRLHWDPLVEVVGGEPQVRKLVDDTAPYAALDPDLDTARELAEKYLEGWRPKDFGDWDDQDDADSS